MFDIEKPNSEFKFKKIPMMVAVSHSKFIFNLFYN